MEIPQSRRRKKSLIRSGKYFSAVIQTGDTYTFEPGHPLGRHGKNIGFADYMNTLCCCLKMISFSVPIKHQTKSSGPWAITLPSAQLHGEFRVIMGRGIGKLHVRTFYCHFANRKWLFGYPVQYWVVSTNIAAVNLLEKILVLKFIGTNTQRIQASTIRLR
jgi:ribosomal protein S18 acetylase RimI-like enzyme